MKEGIFMPRKPRNYIETTFIHIMTQGINKSYIFNEDQDIKYYIKIKVGSSRLPTNWKSL